MKCSRVSFIFLLVLIICSAFAFSQDSSKNESSKKESSTLIPIEIKANLSILDDDGNPINDLDPVDIKIFEDGIEQKITYFVKKETNLNLGLLFDNSGSMRKALDEIVKVRSVLIDNLPQNTEAFVVRFINSDKITIEQGWTSNKTSLKEAIGDMYVDGGRSAVLDAVYLASEKILLECQKTNETHRNAIVLFSDAEERGSYYRLDDLRRLLKGTDIQVFLISFSESAKLSRESARLYSHLLTLETGGTVYTLPKKYTGDDIDQALKRIVGELRSQYIIGYTSTNQSRNGEFRKLTVQIAVGENGEKRNALIRDGFVVPEN